jgi:hypothetical protein
LPPADLEASEALVVPHTDDKAAAWSGPPPRPNIVIIAVFVSTGVWLVGPATHHSANDVTVKINYYLCITTITIITTVTISNTTTVIVFLLQWLLLVFSSLLLLLLLLLLSLLIIITTYSL